MVLKNYNCIPDIVVCGKGLGGGLPIGAFISTKKIMNSLSENPILGHITTFGGNPIICASALETIKVLTKSNLIKQTVIKEKLFKRLLKHSLIEEIRGKGLMLAIILRNSEIANKLVLKAKENNLLLFWLLFEKRAVRITPPLTISKKEIQIGCNIIVTLLNEISLDVN